MSVATNQPVRANARPKNGPARMDHAPWEQNRHEKAISFGPSLRRLLGTMRPERLWFALVIVLGIGSVAAAVVGPKILGRATDEIFAGVIGRMIGRRFPAGTPIETVIEALRAAGQERLADMLAGMAVVPGQSIDFAALGHWLLLALSLYLLAAALGFLQNYLLNRAVQRTVYRIRQRAADNQCIS